MLNNNALEGQGSEFTKKTSFTSQSNFMTNDKSIPQDEEARLKNLHEYNIMDTSPEIIFDEITE